jgi:hypothetical protein
MINKNMYLKNNKISYIIKDTDNEILKILVSLDYNKNMIDCMIAYKDEILCLYNVTIKTIEIKILELLNKAERILD